MRGFAAGLALLTLAGCGIEPMNYRPQAACPTIVEYDLETQFRAALELRELPLDSVVRGRLIPDYSRLRSQVRACQAPTRAR